MQMRMFSNLLNNTDAAFASFLHVSIGLIKHVAITRHFLSSAFISLNCGYCDIPIGNYNISINNHIIGINKIIERETLNKNLLEYYLNSVFWIFCEQKTLK